jgi:hypothetical protein
MLELEGGGTANPAEDVHASVDRFLKKNFKIEDGEDISHGMSRFLKSFLLDARAGAPGHSCTPAIHDPCGRATDSVINLRPNLPGIPGQHPG